MRKAAFLPWVVFSLTACGNGEEVAGAGGGVGWFAIFLVLAAVVGMGLWMLNRLEESNEILRSLQYELRGFIEEQRSKSASSPARTHKKKGEKPEETPAEPEEPL